MSRKGPLRTSLLVISLISFLSAVACAVGAIYLGVASGDPVVAALMASVVFFVGVGVVLQVIARADLPDLRIKR